MSLCFLLAFGFTVAACGPIKSYSGPTLSSDEVAIIEPKDYSWKRGFFERLLGPHPRLRIEDLDGEKPEEDFWKGDNLAVKPGTHTLLIVVESCHYSQYRPPDCTFMTFENLSLEAEAGHTYHVRGRDTDVGPMIWIEDEENGEVVAGRKPE